MKKQTDQPDRRELADKALALRRQGHSIREIAEDLGVSRMKAARLCQRAMRRVHRESSSSVEVLAAVEADNLRCLERIVHDRLGGDTPTPEVFAGLKLLLGISARRSKLLGLEVLPKPTLGPVVDQPPPPTGGRSDEQRVKRIMELLGMANATE
jgi:hypothetical protein